MHLSGLIKSSLIDYPGKVAAVVFTQGCNFRCGFCHNPDLVSQVDGSITEESVFEHLTKRKNILDGVVITGGEPLIQRDIVEFIKKVKGLGLSVKLDTNGSSPEILESLIKSRLLDYIAMDIKGPLDKYEQISSYKNKKFIQTSINLIINSGVDYEFRTTVLPYYHKIDDFHLMGELIKGSSKYVIQGFRPKITLHKSLERAKPFSIIELKNIQDIMKLYVIEVIIHDNLA